MESFQGCGKSSEDLKLQSELELDPELLIGQHFTLGSQKGPLWKYLH